MSKQFQKLGTDLINDPEQCLQLIAGNNPYVFKMNVLKYFGVTVDQRNPLAMVQAVIDASDSLTTEQCAEALKKLIDVPVVEQNLTDVGRAFVVANTQLKSANDDDNDDNSEGPNWGAVLAAAIPGMIGLLVSKPWQNQPSNDVNPYASQPKDNRLIYVGIACVGLLILGIFFLSRQNAA